MIHDKYSGLYRKQPLLHFLHIMAREYPGVKIAIVSKGFQKGAGLPGWLFTLTVEYCPQRRYRSMGLLEPTTYKRLTTFPG